VKSGTPYGGAQVGIRGYEHRRVWIEVQNPVRLNRRNHGGHPSHRYHASERSWSGHRRGRRTRG